jgi:Gpi18-like mannosyltransferase
LFISSGNFYNAIITHYSKKGNPAVIFGTNVPPNVLNVIFQRTFGAKYAYSGQNQHSHEFLHYTSIKNKGAIEV